MRLQIFISATLFLAISATTAREKDSVGRNYRLPKTIFPHSYNLDLTITDDTFVSGEFTGTITILITPNVNTSLIKFHSGVKNTIRNLTISDESFTNFVEQENTVWIPDNVTEIVTVVTKTNLVKDYTYAMSIDYIGIMRNDSMDGFYKSTYTENGVKKVLATTQFEATFARLAFPCFDEPIFKAVFNATIARPSKYGVRFNTEMATSFDKRPLRTDIFHSTPRMSTYLVAFVISEFTSTLSEDYIDKDLRHRVWSRESAALDRKFPAEAGPPLFASMEAFTNITMKDMGIDKMDLFAIPDFAAGAMENWGLVTYRESRLLYDDDAGNDGLQRVPTVIAHEFAHHWFGDLVTPQWWSELWLNEGFATFFEYHLANERYPKFELDKQFVLKEVFLALIDDSNLATQPMSDKEEDINTPTQISFKFGTASYNKAGSVIRMMSHFLGMKTFQAGLQNYLKSHKFGNTRSSDLFSSIQQRITEPSIPTNLIDVMNSWVMHSGYPVVSVSLSGSKLSLSQKRFLLDEDAKSNDTKWFVPISYTTSKETNFENTYPKIWLLPTEANKVVDIGEGVDWLIVNLQHSGYYRVNYDAELWTRIGTALKSKNHANIPSLNKAQIVNDLFNLAEAGQIGYAKALDVISFIKEDDDFYTWYAAIAGYNFLICRAVASKLEKAIKDQFISYIQTIYKTVPFDKIDPDDQIYSIKQLLITKFACLYGDEDCVSKSVALFQNYKNKNETIPTNIRPIVYCYGLHNSSDASDWDFAWKRYMSATSSYEQLNLLSGLSCSQDEKIINQLLKKTITTDSGIRTQDAQTVFSYVIGHSALGRKIGFEFLKSNVDEITKFYKGMAAIEHMLKAMAKLINTDEEIAQFEEFLNRKDLSDDFKLTKNEVLETIKSNKEWMKKHIKELEDIYEKEGGSAPDMRPSNLILVIISVFVVRKIMN